MTTARILRNKIKALEKLEEENYKFFLNQSSGRSRDRYISRYNREIRNLKRQLRYHLGPRTGLALELNRARNNLQKLKNNKHIETNKIKIRVAPEKYNSRSYYGVYGPKTAVIKNFFYSLPKNQRIAIDKRVNNALKNYNKRIENAEQRVKNIENQAARRAGNLLSKAPGMIRRLYEPPSGMVYARTMNQWSGAKLPKNYKELAAMLREAERRGAKRK